MSMRNKRTEHPLLFLVYQFNPAMGRVLSSAVLPPPDPLAPFIRYTLPQIELRRILAEQVSSLEGIQLK